MWWNFELVRECGSGHKNSFSKMPTEPLEAATAAPLGSSARRADR